MNFTREPIIETIISPKEGYKLLVRSSRGSGSEEYFVDAVEVVSFGRGYFFRSLERPKAFLVPVSDYEILEVKETRVALKNVSHERNIKIGGGREAPLRHAHHREQPVHEKEREAEPVSEEEEQPATAEETGLEVAISSRMEKRRDRRRRRHRRGSDEQDWSERRPQERQEQQPQEGEPKAQGGGAEDETKVSSPMFSSLIPPPPTLISETLSRYKDKEFAEGLAQKELERQKLEKEKEEKKKEKEKENPDEESGSESSPLHRVAPVNVAETSEVSSFTSTNFSGLPTSNDPYFY